MRLSRTRSIALATAAAVTAAGVVVPSALAQEETAPDAETAAVSESAAPESESESETPAADESESESESTPEDEPETEAPATAAKVSIEIKADKTKQAITRNLEENDEVKAALAGHANVGWKHEGESLPLGMKFSTVSSKLTIYPGQLRGNSSHTFVATDLATGEVVAEVNVTAKGQKAPDNPDNEIKKTTPRQAAIIVGVAAAIAAALAGMVQFLVPGGWQHVISYFTGQR